MYLFFLDEVTLITDAVLFLDDADSNSSPSSISFELVTSTNSCGTLLVRGNSLVVFSLQDILDHVVSYRLYAGIFSYFTHLIYKKALILIL